MAALVMINVAAGFGCEFAYTPLIKIRKQTASLHFITNPRRDRALIRTSLAVLAVRQALVLRRVLEAHRPRERHRKDLRRERQEYRVQSKIQDDWPVLSVALQFLQL